MMKTRIIATIGPSSEEESVLKSMISEGMSIARINTKYGSREEYLKIISMLKKAGKCSILFDIVGVGMIGWLRNIDFDYLAVSFAETSEQIRQIRNLLYPKNVKIISKIETAKGFENIDDLIDESDGIMVARGDLGRNIMLERIPVVQKIIIRKCNSKGKMDITATEMLLSMTISKIPGRAEVSDVANAVLDGSDALMLSEETAIGKYPVLAVSMMRKIIEEAEKGKKLLQNNQKE